MVMLNPYLQNNQFCADNNVKADEGTCNGDSGTLSFFIPSLPFLHLLNQVVLDSPEILRPEKTSSLCWA